MVVTHAAMTSVGVIDRSSPDVKSLERKMIKRSSEREKKGKKEEREAEGRTGGDRTG